MSTNRNLVSPNKVVQRFEACVCCSKPVDVYNDPHARTMRDAGVDEDGRHWFVADIWCTDCYQPGHPTFDPIADLPPELRS